MGEWWVNWASMVIGRVGNFSAIMTDLNYYFIMADDVFDHNTVLLGD